MDLLIRIFLLAGAFMNLCAVAYLLGIAYVVPMAFNTSTGQQLIFLSFAAVIAVMTTVSWFMFRADYRLLALVVMYSWWIIGIRFLDVFMMRGLQ